MKNETVSSRVLIALPIMQLDMSRGTEKIEPIRFNHINSRTTEARARPYIGCPP